MKRHIEMKTSFLHILFVSLFALLIVAPRQAQANTIRESIFDRLTASPEGMLEVSLETDLVQLLSVAAGREVEYQPATFTFENAAGQDESWEIKVRQRGKFRRRVCDFPPIMLNFDKDDLTAQGMAEHDKLKLVTHCDEDRAQGNDNLLREFLGYQMYRELTPSSYRVRLVRITYIDSKGNLSNLRRYGFIIEDTDEMAERLGGVECEDCVNPAVNSVDLHAETVHAMFQYFIGNTDYSLPMNRNLKLVRRNRDNMLVPVGYDFDFSGLVNASYALPSSHIGQLMIRQRIYLGLPADDATLLEVIKLFQDKREDLLDMVQGFRYLSGTSRDDITNYILLFYDQLDLLLLQGDTNLYARLRQNTPNAIPDGGAPEMYQVRK
ncbi:MAG: hypothetical protein KDC54_14760 [Lewinella sp.]|nr:hypothetical protein [Lewinella sp.]